MINAEEVLEKIRSAVEKVKELRPNRKVYITVSKEVDQELRTFLGTDDYSIRLEELYGCRYQVSPFVWKYLWIVGVFDYSQILGQRNTYQDEMYSIDDLFTYVTDDGNKEN